MIRAFLGGPKVPVIMERSARRGVARAAGRGLRGGGVACAAGRGLRGGAWPARRGCGLRGYGALVPAGGADAGSASSGLAAGGASRRPGAGASPLLAGRADAGCSPLACATMAATFGSARAAP